MKILLVVLGCISCVLGIVGIFVPLLPTTPFLLLSAALWVRSSPRLYGWLLAHPCFGEYVRNFRENRAIPLRAKIISLTLMWGTMLYCIFALLTAWWWAQAALLAVAIGVTWHILSFATLKKGCRCRKTPKGNNPGRGTATSGGGAPRGETVCLP